MLATTLSVLTSEGFAAVCGALGALITAAGAIFFRYVEKKNELRKEHRQEQISDMQFVMTELRQQIKDQKKEIDELKIQVAHLESMQEDVPFPEYTQDRSLRVLTANAAFESECLLVIGKSVADLLGKQMSDIFQPETYRRFDELDTQALRSPTRRAVFTGFEFAEAIAGQFTAVKWPLYKGVAHVGWRCYLIPTSTQTGVTGIKDTKDGMKTIQ